MADDYAGAMAGGSGKVNGPPMPKTWQLAVDQYGEAQAAKLFPALDPANAKGLVPGGFGSPDVAAGIKPGAFGKPVAGTGSDTAANAVATHPAPTSAPPAPPAIPGSNIPDNPAQGAIAAQQAIAGKAMDSLISEYTATLGAVTPYETGQVGQQAVGQATQMGSQIGAGGAAAQGAFANVDATQNADYQKMATADTAGSAGVTKSLGDLKSADSAALGVSPYAGLLTALTSGASYRAETNPQSGASPFTSASTTPQWLKDAYALSVGNAGLAASGATTPGTGSSTPVTPTMFTQPASSGAP